VAYNNNDNYYNYRTLLRSRSAYYSRNSIRSKIPSHSDYRTISTGLDHSKKNRFRSVTTSSTQLFVLSPNPQNIHDFESYRRSIMSSADTDGTEQPMYAITEMTASERYLFDLNGYIVIPNVLTAEEVQHANDAIDRHMHMVVERKDVVLRNAVHGSYMFGLGPGRKDLGRVLEWGMEDSKVFASILNHPRLVPVFHGILGKGYRMDHLPFCILQDYGSEGFQLHGGTIDCMTGEYNPHLAYTCHHDTIRTALLGCSVVLTDHNAGDGGFCVVPGSHKSNFQMPPGMVDGSEEYRQFIQQPVTKAGDVVLFSEGTVHGALPWTPQNRQRRICLYRFAPATNAYGRSYFGSHGSLDNNNNDDVISLNSDEMIMGWPKAMYEGLTAGQRAVLEPPYANRLDRPNLQERDGHVVLTTRSERKKQHDREVFGTKYF
jgi:ectoine hydroxylase-related dioxygenase (phytanoyl-CoA dioxygenase family)